jgi:hypothetical protein
MTLRLQKHWLSDAQALARVRGQMGVYQLADDSGEVIYMSYAGGHSLGGLRGEITRSLSEHPQATQVRFEITTSYLSRYKELLMLHQADHGTLPAHDPSVRLGRLSPAGGHANGS